VIRLLADLANPGRQSAYPDRPPSRGEARFGRWLTSVQNLALTPAGSWSHFEPSQLLGGRAAGKRTTGLRLVMAGHWIGGGRVAAGTVGRFG